MNRCFEKSKFGKHDALKEYDDEHKSGRYIYRYNLDNIPKGGVVIVNGRTNSGKTTLIKEILYHLRYRYDRFVVMSGSRDTSEELSQHVPPVFVFDGFDAGKLDEIYKQQEHDVAVGNPKSLLMIFDDLMYARGTMLKSETFRKIFMNGRHAKILLLLAMQDCKQLPPEFRTQTSLVFVCNEKNPDRRKRIYDAFNPIFKRHFEFDEIMKECTKDYEVMVLDNFQTKSDSISDNVFWYKAKPGRDFRVGDRALWQFSRRLYNPAHILRNHSNPDKVKAIKQTYKKQESERKRRRREKRMRKQMRERHRRPTLYDEPMPRPTSSRSTLPVSHINIRTLSEL